MNRSSREYKPRRYDASFDKLVSLVAYRDSRRSENQRVLREQFHWLARFVFLNSVSASWGVLSERLGAVWIVLERFVSVSVFVQICILLRLFVGEPPRIDVIGCQIVHRVTSFRGVVLVRKKKITSRIDVIHGKLNPIW